MHDPAELAHCGLRVPWVADITQTLRECGVLPPDVPAPRTREELKEMITVRCGVTRPREHEIAAPSLSE